MSHHTKQSYFFAQRKRVLVRRVKKQLDTVSFIGEKREPILSFRPKAIREGEDGRTRPHPKRPASAVSRHSVVQFPPIDVTGPHLTTRTSTAQVRLINIIIIIIIIIIIRIGSAVILKQY